MLYIFGYSVLFSLFVIQFERIYYENGELHDETPTIKPPHPHNAQMTMSTNLDRRRPRFSPTVASANGPVSAATKSRAKGIYILFRIFSELKCLYTTINLSKREKTCNCVRDRSDKTHAVFVNLHYEELKWLYTTINLSKKEKTCNCVRDRSDKTHMYLSLADIVVVACHPPLCWLPT